MYTLFGCEKGIFFIATLIYGSLVTRLIMNHYPPSCVTLSQPYTDKLSHKQIKLVLNACEDFRPSWTNKISLFSLLIN